MAENIDNQEVKSAKDTFRERFSAKHPDVDINDEEAYYGAVGADYDAADKYAENEGKLNKVLSENPAFADALGGGLAGGDPVLILVENYGDELKDYLDDPSNLENLKEARQKYLDKIAKNKELEDEFASNAEESNNVITSFQQDNGLTDEDMDGIVDTLVQMLNDMVVGKVTTEMLDFAMKAKGYDAAVAEAGMDGEVRGRNQKITEKLRKADAGSGLPSQMGGGAGMDAKPNGKKSIFDVARDAK